MRRVLPCGCVVVAATNPKRTQWTPAAFQLCDTHKDAPSMMPLFYQAFPQGEKP